MTTAEMNRRIAKMSPKAVARIERHVRETSYTPREVWAFRIPGSVSLACVNAVFAKVLKEWDT